MDIQEQLQAAVGAHQRGDLDEAQTAYDAILAEAPDQPDALHFSGLLRYQNGDAEAALVLIQRSLDQHPANAGAHNNLGNIYKSLDRREEAVEAYQAALGIDEGHADTWNNLGVLLRGSEQLEKAAQVLGRAVELQPKHAEAWHNLGVTYMFDNKLEEAANAFEACVALGTKTWSDPVWHARLLCALGRKEKAIAHLEGFLQEKPDHPVATYQLAAIRGDTMERATDEYVREHFDSFSRTFDDVLKGLQYKAPEIVAGVVDELMEGRPPVPDVVDLGCGTGLCGPLIRKHCGKLTGIDLSPGMLQKAAELRCYDFLVEGELIACLNDAPSECFNLAVCVDTLCYFGALDTFMAELQGALKPGGVLVATVEGIEGEEAPPYRMDDSGRYAHHRDHIADAARNAGLHLRKCRPEILRKELGKDVGGYVFVVEKSST